MKSLTIITPTTGKQSLRLLIDSILNQSVNIPITHILLYDNFREGEILEEYIHENYKMYSIVIKGNSVQGMAKGSALRAIGLMAADTEWITFADDDIMWEKDHIKICSKLSEEYGDKNWGFCKRRIWTKNDGQYEFLGIDDFESVGEEAKTPYKMVDNNCMFFKRRYGSSASVLYRETKDYNDDRLMYAFLKQYAGEPIKTMEATINQVCPVHLVEFFRNNCTK